MANNKKQEYEQKKQKKRELKQQEAKKRKMKKMAIFVEGQTEQIFVEKLINHIAEDYHIGIEKRRGFGGRDNGRSFVTLSSPEKKSPFYILIVDSSNDGRVLTDIRENYHRLKRQGYDKIIGLRDIYPHQHRDFRKLRRVVNRLLPKASVEPDVCFAVLELETWFIAEYTHFERIHPRLTRKFIIKKTGIDPADKNIERRLCPEKDKLLLSPAGDLDRIYKLARRSYSKKKQQVLKIVAAMDFKFMLSDVNKRVKSFAYFVRHLEKFFESVSKNKG